MKEIKIVVSEDNFVNVISACWHILCTAESYSPYFGIICPEYLTYEQMASLHDEFNPKNLAEKYGLTLTNTNEKLTLPVLRTIINAIWFDLRTTGEYDGCDNYQTYDEAITDNLLLCYEDFAIELNIPLDIPTKIPFAEGEIKEGMKVRVKSQYDLIEFTNNPELYMTDDDTFVSNEMFSYCGKIYTVGIVYSNNSFTLENVNLLSVNINSYSNELRYGTKQPWSWTKDMVERIGDETI